MSVHEVLGRYCHMSQDLVGLIKKVEDDRDVWRSKWYELWGDMQEAREWARYYKACYDGVTTVEQSWVPPDAVDTGF